MKTLEQIPVAKPTAAAVNGNLVPIKQAFFQELSAQAQSTVTKNLNINTMLPVDEGGLGDFPWFWNNGGVFNQKTYSWLNNVWRYNADGYVETDGSEFTTDFFNVIMGTSYFLSTQDQATLNQAVNTNATIVNSVIGDWISAFGPIPSENTTPVMKLSFITSKIVAWGASGLTLGMLRSNPDPMSLLANRPSGSETVINDFMTYLSNTSSVENIQAAVLSYNNQLIDLRRNLQPAPSAASPGWMQTVDDNGTNAIVPTININQSTATIQNALYPSAGSGASFSVVMGVQKIDQNTVQVTASGGIGGQGSIGWFGLYGGASASYNMFSFDEQVQSLSVKMTFNGVTKVTPIPAPYDISSRSGWWNPKPIKDAVNFDPTKGGYKFNLDPGYNFGTNGTFGLISNVVISQQPTFELTYTKANFSKFQQVFQQQSSWGISFLGIPLAGGSQSYYHSELKEDATAGTITITMTPPVGPAPVPTLDQLAYVIGAQILWPGV